MDYTTRVFSHRPKDSSAPILVDADRPDRQISWGDYSATVERIAVGLRSHGVASQDGVGLLSHNDIYYYVLGDGAIAAGAVFTGIPTFVKQGELAHAIRAGGLQWLFVSPEFLELALATVQSLGLPSDMVLLFDPPGLEDDSSNANSVDASPRNSLRKLMAAATASETAFCNVNKGTDPAAHSAFHFFTSGSTGSVKAAVISHQTQVARLDQTLAFAGRLGTGRFLHVIGMYHASGLAMHQQALLGIVTLYVSRASTADAILDRISNFSIRATWLTPNMMDDMTAVGHSTTADAKARLAPLQAVFYGGAPCRREIIDLFRKALPSTAVLSTGYGLTEMGVVSLAAIDDDWVPGCVGSLLPDVEMRIVDPETLEPLSPGSAGEICVRSAACFSGYYDNDKATRETFLPNAPGWFRTGDQGRVDPDTGVLTLVGRLKQIFKVRYEEVSPTEVESELIRHGGIADALVMPTEARDDPAERECMAYIVPQEGAQLTAQGLVDFVASRLAPHKAPTGGIVFCDTIPRGAMGKPIGKELGKLMPLPGSAKFLATAA